MKKGNFNKGYLTSIGQAEGYFDMYTANKKDLQDNPKYIAHRREGAKANGDNYVYI